MNRTEDHFDVVGLGRSYIDIIGAVDETFHDRHGVSRIESRYFSAEALTAMQHEIQSPQIVAGGTIPNTLAGLAALDAHTAYFGNVGDDEAGRQFLKDLRLRGIVDAGNNPRPAPAHSGTCLVLIDAAGERSFALHKGCVDDFSAEALSSFDYSAASYLLVGANLLVPTDSGALIAQTIEKAARSGCHVVASLSQVHNWMERQEFATGTLAPYAGTLIGDEKECAALLAVPDFTLRDEVTLITTKGARGAYARRGKTEVSVPATAHAKIVNTLGAGDQFLAGYLMGQILGRSLEDSLRLGVRCADIILQRAAARPAPDERWSKDAD